MDNGNTQQASPPSDNSPPPEDRTDSPSSEQPPANKDNSAPPPQQSPPAEQPEGAGEGVEKSPAEMTLDIRSFRKPGEKGFTQRSRLFVGNLPLNMTEEEFKNMFAKYGNVNEVFVNGERGFGLIRLVCMKFCLFVFPLCCCTELYNLNFRWLLSRFHINTCSILGRGAS